MGESAFLFNDVNYTGAVHAINRISSPPFDTTFLLSTTANTNSGNTVRNQVDPVPLQGLGCVKLFGSAGGLSALLDFSYNAAYNSFFMDTMVYSAGPVAVLPAYFSLAAPGGGWGTGSACYRLIGANADGVIYGGIWSDGLATYYVTPELQSPAGTWIPNQWGRWCIGKTDTTLTIKYWKMGELYNTTPTWTGVRNLDATYPGGYVEEYLGEGQTSAWYPFLTQPQGTDPPKYYDDMRVSSVGFPDRVFLSGTPGKSASGVGLAYEWYENQHIT